MEAVAEATLPVHDEVAGYSPERTAPAGCYFDAEEAAHVCGFFESQLIHIEGPKAGEPFKLEEWERRIISAAFGWKLPDGSRRYREVFLYVARKNGKTMIVSGLTLYMLFCDGEAGAQVYSAAADKEQSAIIFRVCRAQIENNPDLARRAHVYRTFRSIEYRENQSVYKALSADALTKHGFNSHFVGVDELHAHRNRDLVDTLITSTGSRRQPLVWYITTADFDRESICNEKHDYACKVRDGIIDDPSFLPAIYETASDADWTDPAVWAAANPNLGVSISREYLERECKRAQETPSYQNTFRRLHLNQKTGQDVRWLPMDAWDRCSAPFDVDPLKGRECIGGLDLATTTDVAAFVLAFAEGDEVMLVPRFWVPRDCAEKRERRDRVPYIAWARDGFVTLTDGNVIDYNRVLADIVALGKTYSIREIAFDPWNATATAQSLKDAHGFEMVSFRQGFVSMNEPSKRMERLVMQGKLRHGGNPVLRWMASNVTIQTDPAGNIKPDKQKSAEKIDGIVASVMAIGRLLLVEPKKKSVYSTRGFRSFASA